MGQYNATCATDIKFTNAFRQEYPFVRHLKEKEYECVKIDQVMKRVKMSVINHAGLYMSGSGQVSVLPGAAGGGGGDTGFSVCL